jgi:hypothetical protein
VERDLYGWCREAEGGTAILPGVSKQAGTPVKGSANLKRGASQEAALDDLESLKKTLSP